MSTVLVRRGDTLFAIARRSGVSLEALVRANPQVSNPHLIRPGQRLAIPGGRDEFVPAPSGGAESQQRYRIRVGDTASAIARRAGVSVQALIAANPHVVDPDRIFAGQELRLPEGSGPVSGSSEPPSVGGAGSNPFREDFLRAAATAGVPASWASSPALLRLVRHESGFRPEAKNPSSTAFGLFQFLAGTWRRYLPEVPYGTRDPYWQAVGGFRYIEARYGTPERAWAFWQATVNRSPSMAPPDLRGLAREWISQGYAGY